MFRLVASGLALVGLMALTAVFGLSVGSDPALTRSDSVLPPPSAHLFYLNTAEARSTPWDCSDWQPYPAVADAEDELASSILETLAANRGKTLYCGLDQSDTWTKRQVYDNAHAHNDRDRTQYDGSQGQGRFRGFTAGQEGWLTDGEHGITGVSPERIFEFPQPERRRGWKTVTKRLKVPQSSERRASVIVGSEHHETAGGGTASPPNTRWARRLFRQTYWEQRLQNTHPIRSATLREGYWNTQAQDAAQAYCAEQGYPKARNVQRSGRPADFVNSSGADQRGQGWDFINLRPNPPPNNRWTGQAYTYVLWSATCEKKVRVRRSRR